MPHRLDPPYRFVVDECLGISIVPDALKAVLEEGERVMSFASICDRATKDEAWLRRAGVKGFVTITKDARFRHRPNELRALREANTAIFVIASGPGALMGAQLARAMPTMRRVLRGHDAPLIGRVLDTGDINVLVSAGKDVRKTVKLPVGSRR
jgi:hypothetical protein